MMHERIKMLRKYLNLTQQAFAGRIGLKQNSIALIESGKRNISNQAIFGICREFRVNEQWLRTGEGEMFVLVEEADAITAFIDDLLCDESARFKRRLIRVLSELSEKEWSLLELRLRQITGNADIESAPHE
jgi:HTH-type transcriptional regulator/antitoxin PezA